MGKLRKIGKKIGNGIKKVGRKLKKGLGNIAKAFGKLGPLGSVALSFIIPGIGSWLGGMAGSGGFLGTIASGIQNAAGFVGQQNITLPYNQLNQEQKLDRINEIFNNG